eukprot:21348_1
MSRCGLELVDQRPSLVDHRLQLLLWKQAASADWLAPLQAELVRAHFAFAVVVVRIQQKGRPAGRRWPLSLGLFLSSSRPFSVLQALPTLFRSFFHSTSTVACASHRISPSNPTFSSCSPSQQLREGLR